VKLIIIDTDMVKEITLEELKQITDIDSIEIIENVKAKASQLEPLVINFLPDLLRECHKLIQQGIYSEDGIDGVDGQELLDKIEKHIKVKRSHRG
jgi:hypothetical protein